MEDWTAAPELTGPRVSLVPLTDKHAAGLLQAADDDSIFEWLSFPRPHDLDDVATMIATYRRLDPAVVWAQTVTGSGEVAGITTYYDIAPALRTLSIGWTWLGRRFWRTGFNTEAKLLLLTRAFDDLGCVRVSWHADERNHRSTAAIERLGAVSEGVLRKHKQRRDSSWRNTAVFSVTDDEWPTVRDRLTRQLSHPS